MKGGSMQDYFDWASDLNVACIQRFLKSQEQGIKLQKNFSRNPFKNEERFWDIFENARAQISQLVHSRSVGHIVLTQGTMAGLVYILDSLTRDSCRQLKPGDTVLATDCEIPQLYGQLYPVFGLQIAKIGRCSGKQVRNRLVNALEGSNRPVKAVFLSHVLYRNGTKLPLQAIVAAIREMSPDTIVVIDGAQAVGHVNVNVSQVGADFYVGDFHKWIQGPNNTGFIHCRSKARLEMLAKHATHPMAFPRTLGLGIEIDLCSKCGPLLPATAAIPSALKGFLAGEFITDSFDLAEYLESKIVESKIFSTSLRILAPQDLRTGIIALPLEPRQRDLRQRLFERHGMLVSEKWPKIVRGLKTKIHSQGFLRISCSDNWNTKREIDKLFETLRKEWRKK